MSFQLFHFCTVKIWLFFAFYLKHTKKKYLEYSRPHDSKPESPVNKFGKY